MAACPLRFAPGCCAKAALARVGRKDEVRTSEPLGSDAADSGLSPLRLAKDDMHKKRPEKPLFCREEVTRLLIWHFYLKGSLQLLACGPEEDLVHVHILRLADGKDDRPRKRIGRYRNLVDLPGILGDIRFGDAVWQFGKHCTR